MSVGSEIRKRRLKQGLKPAELARLARVSKAYISELESSDDAHPSAEILFRIATALGTSIGELLGKKHLAKPAKLVIPESLGEFAKEERLPDAEIQMLAAIRYRGKSPQSVEDWRFLYASIQRVTRPKR